MGKIVYKNTAAVICLLITVICFGGSSHADMQEAELFEKAYEYYLVTSPERALETFDLFLTRYPDSSALDSVLFWRAKSLVQLKRGEEAANSFRKLREVYPDSSYSLFAEKELELLNKHLTAEKPETSRKKTSNIANPQIADLEERIRILEREKTDLERQLSDLEKKRQLTEKGLSKALDDKNVLETQLDEARKARADLLQKETSPERGAPEISKLSEEKRALESRLKVSEEKIASLSGELASSEEKIATRDQERQSEIRKFETERNDLQKQVRDLESRTITAKDALSRLEDNRKKQEELAKRSALDAIEIGKLRTEKADLEARLRDAEERAGDLAALKQREVTAGDEKHRLERMLAEKESQNAKTLETVAQLQNSLKDSEKEKALTIQSAQEKIRVSLEEKKNLEEELKKEKALSAALSGQKAGSEEAARKELIASEAFRHELEQGLIEERARASVETKKIGSELAELKRLSEQQAMKNADLAGEISTLRTRFLEYEKPFLKIGKERYNLSAVMRESMMARNVADKIQVRNVFWRTGNIVDDFIAEEVLGRKAREDMISAESSLKESLVKQYVLTDAEAAYLDKYLAVERLVKKRLAAPAVKEKDVREYYDKHREQYLLGRENRIRVLSLKYGKTDELEKGIIAVEMHGEALEGRPFDVIARKRSAIAAMKEMSLSRLPDWARVKLSGLKEGEISNIISVDNELMIIQPMPSRPAYRSFEEARKEIEKKLSAEQSERKQSLDDWLNSLKKDVEFLR